MADNKVQVKYTSKDFATKQDVRWCPGCGDYSILAQVHRTFPDLIGIKKEDIVWVSGIGCSSRFPYYMNTYGIHGIHGRAPAIATGVKVARPDLSVWVATGDGDLLSIGGNHFIHACRKNIDLKILLFNNRIYGLTKGQYSPTSEQGKQTKTTTYGSVDYPFNPIRDKKVKNKKLLFHENKKPMIFGANKDKGIKLDGLKPVVIDLSEGKHTIDEVLVHDEHDDNPARAGILINIDKQQDLPTPIGVFKQILKPTYDEGVENQVKQVTEKKGIGDLEKVLFSGNTWSVN